ncbi:hypothetical protein M569_16649, partial [Genlisea aurea]
MEDRCLQVNNRIPYIYGIWKSAKQSLRWISGVKKEGAEDEVDDIPQGSIAGAGKLLVPLLCHVMQALRQKDNEGRRQGKPKGCWFVESVEEVAQPLRFNSLEMIKHKDTAVTVDFVTMYPAFDQDLLKERLRDSISEAWEWESQRIDSGTQLRVRKSGWVGYTPEEISKDPHGSWTLKDVLTLVNFVVDNGYVERGGVILRQVRGFGMGLACAPQIANLGCYPVERDYAARRSPAEMEHNYRFIDDILTLSGCVPTEEEYRMGYKTTGRATTGRMVYLGMELIWEEFKGRLKFITGMHFRDAQYPIRIRRYPAEGSMVTDSQRMGVITGQFIRAQRLCSVMRTLKAAVQGVVLAAMRRGYKRGELDRMWGKFLVQWWKAEEVRRGELRSWFRKMCGVVSHQISTESNAIGCPMNPKGICKFGVDCWAKDTTCRFNHPRWVQRPPCEGERNAEEPKDGAATSPTTTNFGEGPREKIWKVEGTLWDAPGDGSCLFHCVVGAGAAKEVARLRSTLAQHVVKHWGDKIPGLEETTCQLFARVGVDKMAFITSVTNTGYWGGELELVLLAWITGTKLRVFRDMGEYWEEYAQYGRMGELRRLWFDAKRKHYNLIHLKRESSRQSKPIRVVNIPGYQETVEEIDVDFEEKGEAKPGKSEQASREGSCSTADILVGVAGEGNTEQPEERGFSREEETAQAEGEKARSQEETKTASEQEATTQS